MTATSADLAAPRTGALQRQKVDIRSGDVVLVHTGWGSLWMKDNATFNASSPGISIAAAEWLVNKEVVVVGADNWGVEAFPNPDPSLTAPVHQLLLAKNPTMTDKKGTPLKEFQVNAVMKLPDDKGYTIKEMRVNALDGGRVKSITYLRFEKPAAAGPKGRRR